MIRYALVLAAALAALAPGAVTPAAAAGDAGAARAQALCAAASTGTPAADGPDATVDAGWQDIARGEGAAAVEVFVRALTATPGQPRALWGLAVAGHIARFPRPAVDACFAAAEKALPKKAALFADRGRVLEERGEVDPAIAQYARALSLDETLISAHFGLAGIYARLGDRQRAGYHMGRVNALHKASEAAAKK